ncbi:lipopolysaccharide assembly protein LapA domain-containing protein [Nocardiopsis baichengensis]|uniref:lipopolysaccharide assembly protein LapA domain-containing protein n=1 Tax=Nocardiopsis baichengensis TaxID=280240 RepID=UPI0003464266|nr:LapA family protein [Nocardiopsis baichengensis]
MPFPRRPDRHRTQQDRPPDPPAPQGSAGPAPAAEPGPRADSAPQARAGAVWAAIGALVLLAALLIVFLISNTARVEVSFLALRGELPLAIALLIAMIAGIVVALTGAATRLTLLQHRRRREQRPPADRP